MVHEACRKAQSCKIFIKEAARGSQEGQCACVVVVASVFHHLPASLNGHTKRQSVGGFEDLNMLFTLFFF